MVKEFYIVKILSSSILKKSLVGSVSATVLLMTAHPVVDAQENGLSEKSNNSQESQSNQKEAPKEVNTYEEFKNADGPVSINPASLSNKEMKDLGLNPQQVRSDFGISESGVQAEATKKWSKKIPKSKITGAATTAGGVVSLIGIFVTGGTVTSATAPVVSIFTGAAQSSSAKGVQVGGTATKRLVRENPYQLPVKKWVYKATWAKVY